MKPPVLFFIISILFFYFVFTIENKENSKELYYEKQFNSLLKLNNEYKKIILNYEQQIAVHDSLTKRLLNMSYSSGYMKGVFDYRLFKEYLDTIRKYEIDTANIEL